MKVVSCKAGKALINNRYTAINNRGNTALINNNCTTLNNRIRTSNRKQLIMLILKRQLKKLI